jgi:1-phosphofructokinase family hexose kinase
MMPILCFGPTPALQRGLRFADWDTPGDVVRTADVDWSVGGKATNAARAVVRGGGQATLMGPAGGMNGERMKALLIEEGLEGVWVEVEAETRICQTLLDGEGHRIRELVEDALPLSLGEWGELFAKSEQALPFHAGLLLCGSLPMEAPKEVYATLVELAKAAGRKVVMDVKGPALEAALPHKPDLVKINRDELRDTTGSEDVLTGMKKLMDMGAGAVMITDGPNQAYVAQGKKHWRYELPKIQPVNPIGGGDTVTGMTALNWLAGKALQDAARLGLGAGTAQTLRPRPAEFDLSDAERFAREIRMC